MCKVFEASFGDPEFWGGTDFIPFIVEELNDIALFDAQSENTWTRPPPAKPTFFELCEQLRAPDEVLTMPPNDNVAPIEAVPANTPTVEASTPQDTTPTPASKA